MFGDQLLHVLKQGTQPTEAKPFLYGHIASYDPTQHRVRCIIPSMTDQDGAPTLSPWMPMGTMSAGAGSGVQVIYQGGATADNPTGGEQVLIAMFDRMRGVAAVPCMFYHATNKPPATNLPTKADGYGQDAAPILPGDVILSAPPATANGPNSFIRLRQGGLIEVWCAGQLNADVVGDINVTTETGNASVMVTKGNATVQAPAGTIDIVATAIRLSAHVGDALRTLCTSAFAALYNRHTHPAPNGQTGVPSQQADASTMTTIVQAE